MVRLILLTVVAALGCEPAARVQGPPDSAAPPPTPDFGPRPDADRPPPDAATDAGPDALAADGGEPGDGDVTDAGDAGDGGMADAGPIVPVAIEQVGVAASEQLGHIVWAEEAVIKSQQMTAEALDGPPIVRHTWVRAPTHVAAAVAGNTLWAIYGDADGAELVRVQQMGEAPVPLELRPPFLAGPFGEGGTRLIVFGLTAAGHVGWQVVAPNDPPEVGPLQSDPRVHEVPTSLARTNVGDVARFEQAGVCQFYDEDAQRTGIIECLSAPGAVLSDDERPFLFARQVVRRNGLLQEGISPLFDFRTRRPWVPANTLVGAPRLQPHGGYYPFVGLSNQGGNQNQTQLYAVRAFALLESEETWPEWPFDARAVAVVGETGWVMHAGEDGRLEFTAVPMQPRDFGAGLPLRLPDTDMLCPVPTWEVCDAPPGPPVCEDCGEDDQCRQRQPPLCGGDEDCDEVVNNGLCCDDEGSGWEKVWDPQAPVTDVKVSALYSNTNGYRFASTQGDGRWTYWYMSINSATEPYRVHACPNGACPNGWACREAPYGGEACRHNDTGLFFREAVAEGANEAFGLYALGEYTAFIARDGDSAWRIWWYHPSRGLLDNEVVPPKVEPEAIGCSEILAADVVENMADEASMVVVCRDRMVRLYPEEGVEKQTYTFAGLDIDPAQWATITLSTPDIANAVTILVGSRREARRSLRAYVMERSSPEPRRLGLPPLLEDLANEGGEALDHPITLHRIDQDRPAVQLPREGPDSGPVRVLMEGLTGPEWRNLALAPDPARYAYAKGRATVVASEETGMSTRFWAVDVTAEAGVTPWAQRPIYESDAPATFWDVAQTSYSQFLILFIQDQPQEDQQLGTWRVITRWVTCRSTGLRAQP